MPLFRRITLFFCWALLACVVAQGQGIPQARILILLDESSSMIKTWADGHQKYKEADALILRIMDSVYAVNPGAEFSLRVFGHQNTVEENNCYDTKNEVAFAKENRTQMALRLDAIRPLGVTPIAYSLMQAAEQDIVDLDKNVYSLILITDGGESCGGDICAVMRELIRKKVYFKPYIIGLEDDAMLSTMYACMGNYLQVTREDQVAQAVSTVVNSFHPMLTISRTEYKQLLTQAGPPPAAPPATESHLRLAPLDMPGLAGEGMSHLRTLPHRAIADDFALRPWPVPPPVVRETRPTVITVPVLTTAASKTHIFGPDDRVGGVPGLLAPPGPPALPPARPANSGVPALAAVPGNLLPADASSLVDGTVPGLALPPPPPPVVRDTVPPITGITPPIPDSLPSATFRLAKEPARETSLELYFINSRGMLAMSQPRVILVEHSTGRVERDFTRKVDRLGNVDVQEKIPTGYYDIYFPTKKGLVVRKVPFEPRKKNKITVLVKDSKIFFKYAGDTGRPVSEYKATVTKLNPTPGKEREDIYFCNNVKEYEPASYEIRLTTIPRRQMDVTLDFNEDTTITLPQPGYANFSSAEPLPKNFVQILYYAGGAYHQCYTLDVNDPEAKHLRMDPGKYEVIYEKGRKGTVAPKLTEKFEVNPNEETAVTLE